MIEPQLRGETPVRELTFSELIPLYLERHAANVRPRTVATLTERLRHAERQFGEIPLRDLERMSGGIASWQARLPERSRHGVVQASQGGVLCLDNWRRRVWSPAIEAADIRRPARIYDLRSTFASNALSVGVNVHELARIMGTSVRMIERHYGALLDGALESIYRAARCARRPCQPTIPIKGVLMESSVQLTYYEVSGFKSPSLKVESSEVNDVSAVIYIDVRELIDDFDFYLLPKQARELAKLLVSHAEEAEQMHQAKSAA